MVEARCDGCRRREFRPACVGKRARALPENRDGKHEFRFVLQWRFKEVRNYEMRNFSGKLRGKIRAYGECGFVFSLGNFAEGFGVEGSVVDRRLYEFCPEFCRQRPNRLARFVKAPDVLDHQDFSARVFEDFREFAGNLLRMRGNLLAVSHYLRAQKAFSAVHYLRNGKTAEGAESVALFERHRVRRNYPAVLDCYFYAAVARAESAHGLRGFFGFAEPLCPTVCKAARGTSVYARAAKSALFRAPRLFEFRRNFRVLSPVGNTDCGLAVHLFADAEAPAAKYAQVVVFVDKRVVALRFAFVVDDRKPDVRLESRKRDLPQLAVGAV